MGRRLVAALASAAAAALIVTAGVLAQQHLFHAHHQSALAKYMPLDGDTGESLDGSSSYWTTRLSYPTGNFNPDWVRRAVAQDAHVPRASFSGQAQQIAPGSSSADTGNVATPSTTGSSSAGGSPDAAPTAPFISLGPQPLRMTGCSGCYNYTSTEGRMNAVAVDPTTTTNGSIVAYAASVGGGVWKTINCCTASTSWAVTTDDPMINTTSIDALAIDPHDHNTVYAGTGDLNYGSFSMGSQGILKSTDGGQHWTVLGQSLFGMQYVGPAGANSYPQYQAVGKVAIDPNNSSNVVAGTKSGLYFSYDAGSTWTGPCLTNAYTSQRQDTTALILTDLGGGTTRILAATGTRGITTGVQPDLGLNGANGIYTSTMQSSGCPGFTLLSRNDNGFDFGAQVTGSPYTTGAPMNGGSGTAWSAVGTGNQLGRIDMAVAPSDPDTIYAQVQSEAINANSGCANAQGCQLGVWSSIDGGTSWSFLGGSAGGSLRNCSNGQGDYNQNWYDQGVAVDPNNPDRILVDTFDVWSATRTGSSFFDVSCGYSYSGSAGQVHTDQHAITYVPGNSSFALFGNDGGLRYSTNVDTAFSGTRPTFNDLNNGINTIEFYSGDISGNFFNSAQPYANGGAQDNGSSTAIFNGAPTGPAQWQMGVGGDGFFARIDPVANVLYQGGNSGGLSRCTSGVAICTGASQTGRWSSITGPWTTDTISFVLPYDIFKGTPGNPGGQTSTDCAATACNHIIAAGTKVYETVTANTGSARTMWYTDSASLVKGTLGNRSYINQLAYSPATSTLAIAGTSDGNVQVGRNMGAGTANSATWTNLTAGNAVLPNRPMLDVAMDPRSLNTATAPIVGYAAVGGFNSNTPTTPGHVYQVTCAQDCASFTWADKTGNLPDIPADSIIVNPKDPQQVYAGTDIGLYVTDDITAAAPTWYKLQTGLPNVMIWDLQIDRGSTALSVWTRSRGAYVWRLPSSRLVLLDQSIAFAPIGDHTYGDADFDVSAIASSGVAVTFAASGTCTSSGTTVHIVGAGSCTVTASAAGNLDYKPAPDASQTFTIAQEAQSISIDTPTPKKYGDADFDIAATSTSGLPVSLDVSGKCTLSATTSPATVHLTGGGECDVTASQAGDDNWQAAPNEVRTFEIDKADQTVSFDTVTDHTYGDADFSVAGTSTSGLDVHFRASGDCAVDGTTVHITGAGDCTVTAYQPGDDDYNPAPDVAQTFAIAQATQSVTFAALADKTFGDGSFDLAATASSGLAVSYAASGDCSVTGATVHIDHAGSCTITASQPGDANYESATSVDQTFSIARQPQTIAFGGIANKTLGDADFQVGPTSNLGLPVYVVATSGPCTVVGVTAPVTVHITGAGTCVLTATQDGDADHAAASPVSQSFTIAKGSQTITFAPLADRVFGGPFAVTATSSAGLVVSLTASGAACTVSGATVTMTGVGKCTIVAAQSGSQDYTAAASVTRSFTVSNSTTGSATGLLLRPATGGTIVFSVDANAPGPKGLSGALVFLASHGLFFRPIAALQFTAKTITAFGLGAGGHSAWFAGVGTNGQSFVAYAADSTTRRLFRRNDGDLFQLWVGGVLQTGDGTLTSGNVTVSTR